MTKRCLYESIDIVEYSDNIDLGSLHDCYLLLSRIRRFKIYTFTNPGPLKIRIRNKSKIIRFKETTRMTRAKLNMLIYEKGMERDLGPGIVRIEERDLGLGPWFDNKKVEALFEALFV